MLRLVVSVFPFLRAVGGCHCLASVRSEFSSQAHSNLPDDARLSWLLAQPCEPLAEVYTCTRPGEDSNTGNTGVQGTGYAADVGDEVVRCRGWNAGVL